METRTDQEHRHRWRIAEPDGRKELPGTCSGCGATREFKAGADCYVNWDDWRSGPPRTPAGLREVLG